MDTAAPQINHISELLMGTLKLGQHTQGAPAGVGPRNSAGETEECGSGPALGELDAISRLPGVCLPFWLILD